MRALILWLCALLCALRRFFFGPLRWGRFRYGDARRWGA